MSDGREERSEEETRREWERKKGSTDDWRDRQYDAPEGAPEQGGS